MSFPRVEYSTLAGEYYNAARHPTSANLRQASVTAIRKLVDLADFNGRWCDLGAGRSVVAELLSAEGKWSETGALFLVDRSEDMLRHTPDDQRRVSRCVVSDATSLPFSECVFDLVVVSLGDPFNGPSLWRELARTVRRNGGVVFTTPARAWATSYRSIEGSPDDAARFDLQSGKTVHVDSFVFEHNEQVAMASAAGFTLESQLAVRREALLGNVSTKLASSDAILSAFRFERALSR
jgi:SAM-dependent methyltransferase